ALPCRAGSPRRRTRRPLRLGPHSRRRPRRPARRRAGGMLRGPRGVLTDSVDAEHGSRTKELDQMSTATEAILDGLRAGAEEHDGAGDSVHAPERVVPPQGEKKLTTTVALSIFARTAHLQAFVIRHPDENSAEFNRWLLQKNLKPGPVTFAIDSLGDVYLRTSVPRQHLLDELDALLGAMLDAADSSFNELLLIGFLTG